MYKEVAKIAKLLSERNLTIAFAESATAGRLASEFSLATNSGGVLRGGIVCYDACIKEDVLKVPHNLIKQFTPESAEVTAELCIRLKKLMPADIHVAVTGLTTAGGSETPEKPVGTMFIHLLYKDKSVRYRHVFKGTPERIISRTVLAAARIIKNELLKDE